MPGPGTLCPVDLRSALHLLRYPVGQKLLHRARPPTLYGQQTVLRAIGYKAQRRHQPAGGDIVLHQQLRAHGYTQARCCGLQAQVEMLKHQITACLRLPDLGGRLIWLGFPPILPGLGTRLAMQERCIATKHKAAIGLQRKELRQTVRMADRPHALCA